LLTKYWLTALLLGFVLTGCGVREAVNSPDSTPGQPASTKPATAAPRLPSETPKPTLPTVLKDQPLPTDPIHAKLIGSAWKIQDMEIRFLSGDKMHVLGAKITPYSPGGITTRYRYSSGQMEINVMGQPFALTWDGTTLAVNGLAATKIDFTPAA
jgi:hypothetical protein